jgi:hypothetical protein
MQKDRVDASVGDEAASGPAPQRSSDPHRSCAVCGVKLSLYNPCPHCWNHTIGYPWRGPSAKPKFPD